MIYLKCLVYAEANSENFCIEKPIGGELNELIVEVAVTFYFCDGKILKFNY